MIRKREFGFYLLAWRFNELVDADRDEFVNDWIPIPCLPIPLSNSIQSLKWLDNLDNSLFKFCDEPLENKKIR